MSKLHAGGRKLKKELYKKIIVAEIAEKEKDKRITFFRGNWRIETTVVAWSDKKIRVKYLSQDDAFQILREWGTTGPEENPDFPEEEIEQWETWIEKVEVINAWEEFFPKKYDTSSPMTTEEQFNAYLKERSTVE